MADRTRLPRYVSHKRVEAAPISWTAHHPEGFQVGLDLGDGAATTIIVGPSTFLRYAPNIGDYLVIYEDGYASVSPKAVFERGYDPAPEVSDAVMIGHG